MTLMEAYEASALAKAVEDAGLGHIYLKDVDAVLIHDTDYSPKRKTAAEKSEMRGKVERVILQVFGRLAREVNVLVDPDAGAMGHKCYCTAATYVVAHAELAAA
ncbi:MAG: hypothetical protein K6F50_06235 [Kiritimatiellae bacterium]|nr:hypothetical protein [Kiritimatiellia bacterium]